MNLEQLKQVQRAEPFRPYRMHLASGRQLDVRHREFVMPSPSGRFVLVYQPDDSFDVVDLMLVDSLEVLKNGTRGGRKPRGKSKGGR